MSTPVTGIRESLARLEERERARALLLDERFDRQDEMLVRIEARLGPMSERVGSLEKTRAYAKAWLAGAMFVGTSLGALGSWLISLAGK